MQTAELLLQIIPKTNQSKDGFASRLQITFINGLSWLEKIWEFLPNKKEVVSVMDPQLTSCSWKGEWPKRLNSFRL